MEREREEKKKERKKRVKPKQTGNKIKRTNHQTLKTTNTNEINCENVQKKKTKKNHGTRRYNYNVIEIR